MLTAGRTRSSEVLRDQVYAALRTALVRGKFIPGEKITIRWLAGHLGTSLTPVREALGKLVAEGALEDAPNRSVRIPVMTADKIHEIRDIRIAVEGLAAARAAACISKEEIRRLRRVSAEINSARNCGDVALDIEKVAQFQFIVYEASHMPRLVRLIENLWLQTGPYINLLFPDYVASRRGEWRARLCEALERRDAAAAQREIAGDIREALDYVASVIQAADRIAPARVVTLNPRGRGHGRGRRAGMPAHASAAADFFSAIGARLRRAAPEDAAAPPSPRPKMSRKDMGHGTG